MVFAITFNIQGARIAVRSTSDVAIDLLRARFGVHVSDSTGTPEATISIATTAPPVFPSDIRREFSWVRSRPLWGDFEGDAFRLTDGDSVILTRYKKRRCEIFIRPETLEDVPFASQSFFLLPVLELLRTLGFFLVHGALLLKEGRGCLILGSDQSGKSTLSAALLTEGWRLVGDDALLFRLESDASCRGFPLDRDLGITREAAAQLGFQGQPTADPSKVRIPRNQLPANLVAKCAVPDWIICLTAHDSDSATASDPSEVFKRLVDENPLVFVAPALAPSHVETMRTLIRNARSKHLSLRRKNPFDLKEIASRFLRLVPLTVSSDQR